MCSSETTPSARRCATAAKLNVSSEQHYFFTPSLKPYFTCCIELLPDLSSLTFLGFPL